MAVQSKNLMTEGSVWKKMVLFAIPVFIGQLFQQLYNTADSLIVGNFLDSNALAAVTSSGNLIFLIVGFFSGVALGAGVVLSNFIGAQNKRAIETTVHTFISLSLIASIILTLIGTLFAPVILRWMNTPEDVMPNSVTYFRIYFTGSIGFVMYNTFMGILQAAGDSKHPLYFLILSSIINIILDLLFIGVFHMGVGSAAFATAISQLISALLCMNMLLHINEDYRFMPRKLCMNLPTIKKIISYGVPSGLQNSIIGFANVIVQSFINWFGEMAMAGHGAYSKIEGFAFLPITSFTMAMTTFIGQNIGAEKYDRVKKGSLFGTICAIILAQLTGFVLCIWAPSFIRAFVAEPEAIALGAARTRTCALFYIFLAYSHSMAAIFRGHGKASVPMFIMLICWCVIRVSILAVWGTINRTIVTINWVYPITWMCSTLVFTIYYFCIFKRDRRLK